MLGGHSSEDLVEDGREELAGQREEECIAPGRESRRCKGPGVRLEPDVGGKVRSLVCEAAVGQGQAAQVRKLPWAGLTFRLWIKLMNFSNDHSGSEKPAESSCEKSMFLPALRQCGKRIERDRIGPFWGTMTPVGAGGSRAHSRCLWQTWRVLARKAVGAEVVPRMQTQGTSQAMPVVLNPGGGGGPAGLGQPWVSVEARGEGEVTCKRVHVRREGRIENLRCRWLATKGHIRWPVVGG